jgi:cytochrome c-type biogenesis protein CcsB
VLSHTYWLVIHVAAAITATGVLMISGVVSSVHLARRRYERLVTAGQAPGFSAVTRSLPNAKTLDRVEYRLIAFGFPIWTFAVMAGAIWAEAAWGHYWQWDPKETWALITWIVYAGYLHARSTPGLRKWAAHISSVAFATMIVNYYVINIVVVGKHSYAGISH